MTLPAWRPTAEEVAGLGLFERQLPSGCAANVFEALAQAGVAAARALLDLSPPRPLRDLGVNLIGLVERTSRFKLGRIVVGIEKTGLGRGQGRRSRWWFNWRF